MSLQVWLPLNGDLHNQGLNDMQFTLTSGAAITINNNGKIGKCYERVTSKTAGYIVSNKTINLNGDLSICCWAKVTGDVGSDTAQGLISNHNHSNSTGFGLNVKYISSTDYRICCSTGSGSSRTYKDYYGTTNIKNEWHHLALTYNNTKKEFQLWVDGIVEKTQSKTNVSTDSVIRLFDWSIGLSTNTYKPACCLSDVRIYDHCLSAKEVEEIAKGLVLHYKLDDAYFEGTHNYMSASQSMPNLETQIINDVSTTGKYWNKIPIDGLGTYTFSVYIKNTTNKGLRVILRAQTSSKSDVGNYIPGNLIDSGKEGWSIVTVDLTTITNAGGVSIKTGMWLSSGAMNTLTSNPIMGYMQLEKNDHRTPWTLGGTTRAASTIAYDSSGYQNNGTITGNLTCNADSPRYNLSTNFPGNIYSKCVSPSSEGQTISLWVKWDSIPSGQSVVYVDYKSKTGLGLMSYGILCSSCSLNSYTFSKSNITANTWYHFIIVCPNRSANAIRKLYINGIEQTATSKMSNWSYTIDELQIGKRSTTSDGFVGSISDFRIYATVLTESQIQELYNTSALIDKDGNVYPRELVEE